MEFASRLRWILVVGVMIIALILVVWGLFTIASNIFNPDESTDTTTTETEFTVATTNTARYMVDGPTVANDQHRSYQIDVSSNVVSMRVYSSYGQVLLSEKSYVNTSEAYQAFLSALETENVTARSRNTDTEDDYAEMGVCPSGKRYIVELDTSVRRWSTSCSNRDGTAGFNMNAVGRLFQLQVPDYNTLVSGTGL